MKHKVGEFVTIIADECNHQMKLGLSVVIERVGNGNYSTKINGCERFFIESDCESVKQTHTQLGLKALKSK